MAGMYSNDQEHLNSYNNQTAATQWKTFPEDKGNHMIIPNSNHEVMTSSLVSHNAHEVMTSVSLNPQMMINVECKNAYSTPYYPSWPGGHINLSTVAAHSSFGQMLGAVDPSAPSVNRQQSVPVVSNVNVNNAMATSSMGRQMNRDASMVVLAQTERQGDSSQMSMHKQYWSSPVSGLQPPDVASGCILPPGHVSHNHLRSETSSSSSSSHTPADSAMCSATRVYQTGRPLVLNCVTSLATSNCCTSSTDIALSDAVTYSQSSALTHCYQKAVSREQLADAHEDIVAKALSESLNSQSDHYDSHIRDDFLTVNTSMSNQNHNTQSFVTLQKPPQFDRDCEKPFNPSVEEDSFPGLDARARRGPGRPPGSACSSDDPQSKPYKCDYCDRRFKHSQQRRVHVMSHTGERPHTCPYCQKGFKTLAQKTDHIRVHTGDKPYKCTICWREFGKYATMKKHLNTHLDKPPYQCSHCDKAFYLAERLKVHVREHTDERPFQCDQCERAFKNSNHLKFHKMVHSGEVPYRCEVCWKGFQDKVKFDRHQICHQNDNLLRCANCQLGFHRVEQMTQHFEVCKASQSRTEIPNGWVSF